MTGAAPRRIGIVVTDAYADEDPDHDTPLLLEALRARGVAAESVVWHDAGVDLGAFELLVIRSPWDYPERPAEFVAWLDQAAAATRVVNPPHTVRWNLDKRYLAEHGRSSPLFDLPQIVRDIEAHFERLALQHRANP